MQSRRRTICLTRTMCLALAAASLGATTPRASAVPDVGVNLSSVVYWNSEYPFVDIFKWSRPFGLQEEGQPFNLQPLTAELNGYPTEIPAGFSAQATVLTPDGFPRGDYVMLYDGVGDVEMGLGAVTQTSSPGRITFNIKPTSGTVLTRITSTDTIDPVRNIRMVPIAHEAEYQSGFPANPFSQQFLDTWADMKSFRFMNWMSANGSPVKTWADRTTPLHATQGDATGVALEHMIQLANQTGTNPWFTIPHEADDQYIANFATVVRDTLDPSLVARVEYSNEVWNSIFSQAEFATQKGIELGLAPEDDNLAKLRYYSKRSVEMFDIFEDVFTLGGLVPSGMDRLVRVMGAKSANDWVAEQVMTFEDAYQKVDALAIAPYFGEIVSDPAQAAAIKQMSWAQLMQLTQDEVDEAVQEMANHRVVADQYGVQLFAYEAGQHFVGTQGQENDQQLTDIFIALNRSPEMRDFYVQYLEAWEQIGGDDMMVFSSVSEPSKFGSWGLLEYQGQDLAEAPKLQGVLEYLGVQGIPDPPDPSMLLGDANNDGQVTGADLIAVQQNFGNVGATNGQLLGDANDDGQVTGADLIAVQQNFGAAILPPINVLLGDANNDGQVTGADLIAVQQSFGDTGLANGLLLGDANDDGQVTGADLIAVQQNFGSVLSPAAAPVPEPATLGLLLASGLTLIARPKRAHLSTR